jgi:hypothetical protein
VLVKVADFSEAKAVRADRSRHLTRNGTGAQFYRAPLANQRIYTALGDVFSWGMCFSEAILQACPPCRPVSEVRN